MVFELSATFLTVILALSNLENMIKVLFEYLETLVQQQQQVLAMLQVICKMDRAAPQEWLDDVDVKQLLKISDSTLYRLRKGKHVSCKKIGGKWYYEKAVLIALLKP
jgi:hypothetical protein